VIWRPNGLLRVLLGVQLIDGMTKLRKLDGFAYRQRWCRVKRRNLSSINELETYYREAKRIPRLEIRKSKSTAWSELILSIDDDPWGRPYKLVLNRLCRISPCLTETLNSDSLHVVLDFLFPAGTVHDPVELWWNIEVSLDQCVVRLRSIERYSSKGEEWKPCSGAR